MCLEDKFVFNTTRYLDCLLVNVACAWYTCYLHMLTGTHNLIKITSLTCSPLLICHSMWDLRKPQSGSHVSNPNI